MMEVCVQVKSSVLKVNLMFIINEKLGVLRKDTKFLIFLNIYNRLNSFY